MDALVGQWQRTVTSRAFGSFAPQPAPESFVVVERSGDELRWSFGASLGAVRLGYTTALPPAAASSAAGAAAPAFAPLAVAISGGSGWGAWRADGVLTLTLLAPGGALATQTYRVLDADTLAVSLADVPAARGGDGAVLQEGFLFRLGAAPLLA